MIKSSWIYAAIAAALIIGLPLQFQSRAAAGYGCDVSASQLWAPGRLPVHRVEAFSHGPSCAHAVVVIVVRGPNGVPLWNDSMPAAQVMTFAGLNTRQNMGVALRDWMTQNHLFKTSADLPVWKKGDAAPTSGEFPFYPDEGVDRDYYEQVRAGKVPVFCYVQGMESIACVVLKDGGMTKIGLQTFPG